MYRIVRKVFKVDGSPTDVTSAVLSDPTETFGVKRNDTNDVIAANNTAMTRVSEGTYEYQFADTIGVSYTAYVKFVYQNATYRFEVDFSPRMSVGGMAFSYSSLLERVGHYLFGIRDGFSTDQLSDINDCIRDGLHRVYSSHNWSFFRPLVDVTTTQPYSTGTVTVASGVVTLTGGVFPAWASGAVIKIGGRYYHVKTRDNNTQITLQDNSVTIADANNFQLSKPEVELDAAFESVANDSDLTYYPESNRWYKSVEQRHDATIRKLLESNPEFNRPCFYSVRTTRFDPNVGSRKVLAFYPLPDKEYVLRVPMILRPTMIDESNPYPIGGELLSQTILEACLAAAEHNFEEREHVHEKRYQEMIALAIKNDQERSSPKSLGPDAPFGERARFSVFDYDYRLREQRIGQIIFDGESL
jgi:hypothetical protein